MAAFDFYRVQGHERNDENSLADPELVDSADTIIIAPRGKNTSFITPKRGKFPKGAGTLTVNSIKSIQKLLFIPFISEHHLALSYRLTGIDSDMLSRTKAVCQHTWGDDRDGENPGGTAYYLARITQVASSVETVPPAFSLGLEALYRSSERSRGCIWGAGSSPNLEDLLTSSATISIQSDDTSDPWGDETAVYKAAPKSTVTIAQRPEQSAMFQFYDAELGMTGARATQTSPYIKWELVKRVKNKVLAKPELKLQIYHGA